ncbi:uncharacterized protein ATNIH1004_002312 [Aspergillus tanneri]|uniref:Uncharacterized protein n=1 Tax=Aspergillus tanneri TaxID=1220188 RepID=A0A5M9MRA2_9EURO|nr:uncharacterized protein ATNIH1004_002312 [Aspergillus tanneri]KAA8649641.1 hypothetical protein ATNIH1004_002312 [Aspergillus tanneri]
MAKEHIDEPTNLSLSGAIYVPNGLRLRKLGGALSLPSRPTSTALRSVKVSLYTGSSWVLPFCLGDKSQEPEQRFQQWREKATLINHIDNKHLAEIDKKGPIQCPHPCCENRVYSTTMDLRRHFYNVHSIEEPRRNCVSRKRKWVHEDDTMEYPAPKKERSNQELLYPATVQDVSQAEPMVDKKDSI